MKAIVWTSYGPADRLQFAEVAKPVPRDDEVLIRVFAATVTAGDCELRNLRFSFLLRIFIRFYMGLTKPRRKILGQELAGVVEAVGEDVTRFKKGDQVFGTTGFRFGAYAEFDCVSADSWDAVLATKPANMTCEEAATVPMGGLEALRFLRRGKLEPGQKVLINGAGGSIGTVAVQLAKYYGAEVTGVDNTGKLDMLRSIGADKVIDYTRKESTESRETYDAIFDVIGKGSIARGLRLLKPQGRYLLANPRLSSRLQGRWGSRRRGRQFISKAPSPTTEDLVYLKELIEAGKIGAAIDRRYPLEQVPEAHRYVESGQARGKVVITISQNSPG